MMNFVIKNEKLCIKTRIFVSKNEECVFKMVNFADTRWWCLRAARAEERGELAAAIGLLGSDALATAHRRRQ